MEKSEWIHGLHTIQTVLEYNPNRVLELNVQQGRYDKRLQQVLNLAHQVGVSVWERDRKELDQLTKGATHQGVVARCRLPQPMNEEAFFKALEGLDESPFLLVLDGVTDPHNLGACLRTADAAGVHAIIAPKDKAADLNATVCKAASGAAETVSFVQVTNLARALRGLQERGVWLIGAELGEASASLYDLQLTGPVALAMGAEGHGLRRLTREHCDFLAYVPMAGAVASLNVSVATGVCLFEARRQRLNAAQAGTRSHSPKL